MPNQDRRLPLRRLEISFSQGAKWKALISTYIGTIPLSGDALEHNASGDPPPRIPVSSAMSAKVGAAARYRKSAALVADALPSRPSTAPEPRLPENASLMLFSPGFFSPPSAKRWGGVGGGESIGWKRCKCECRATPRPLPATRKSARREGRTKRQPRFRMAASPASDTSTHFGSGAALET